MQPVSPPDSVLATLDSPEATLALGARLAGVAELGLFVALDGELGAGKTTLARGFLSAWCGQAVHAPSPTYTLVQTYEGVKGTVLHADLYRLKHAEEAEELGLLEGQAEHICLVEWASRLGALTPTPRLEITLQLAPHGRIAQIAWRGPDRPDWMAHLA